MKAWLRRWLNTPDPSLELIREQHRAIVAMAERNQAMLDRVITSKFDPIRTGVAPATAAEVERYDPNMFEDVLTTGSDDEFLARM